MIFVFSDFRRDRLEYLPFESSENLFRVGGVFSIKLQAPKLSRDYYFYFILDLTGDARADYKLF